MNLFKRSKLDREKKGKFSFVNSRKKGAQLNTETKKECNGEEGGTSTEERVEELSEKKNKIYKK